MRKLTEFLLLATAATAFGWFIGCLVFIIVLGRVLWTEPWD